MTTPKPAPEKWREWWISRTEDGDWDVCSVDLSDNKNYVHVIEHAALTEAQGRIQFYVDAASAGLETIKARDAEIERLRLISQDRDAQNLKLTKDRDAARAECERLKNADECAWKQQAIEQIETLNDQEDALLAAERALEYYANHESVIKEAYHSNDEKQITCVHTFINHVAKDALAQIREGRGK